VELGKRFDLFDAFQFTNAFRPLRDTVDIPNRPGIICGPIQRQFPVVRLEIIVTGQIYEIELGAV